MFFKWILSLFGYEKTTGKDGSNYGTEEQMELVIPHTKKRRFGRDKKMIQRDGQLNMEVVFSKDDGRWFLMGGMCIEIKAFDTDLEIPGVDENGWNGLVSVAIDGNGVMQINQETTLEDDEFVYGGDLDLSKTNYIPYQVTKQRNRPRCSAFEQRTSGKSFSNSNSSFPTRYNNVPRWMPTTTDR